VLHRVSQRGGLGGEVQTKMSQHKPVASTGCDTRLVATDGNATVPPSAEIAGRMLSLSAPLPAGDTLARRGHAG
jgi:hypothetical protein